MDITKDLLLFHKFEYNHDKGFADFDEADYFYKTVGELNHTFTITIHNLQTNMVGRNWTCIIDNDEHNTVASVEVQTTDHLNQLFDIMNINYSI